MLVDHYLLGNKFLGSLIEVYNPVKGALDVENLESNYTIDKLYQKLKTFKNMTKTRRSKIEDVQMFDAQANFVGADKELTFNLLSNNRSFTNLSHSFKLDAIEFLDINGNL